MGLLTEAAQGGKKGGSSRTTTPSGGRGGLFSQAAAHGSSSSPSKERKSGLSIGRLIDPLMSLLGTQPVQRTLRAADAGRAAVLAGVRAVDDVTEGRGLSVNRTRQRFNQRQGVGDWIEESRPDAPRWAKLAGGFVGDVALDPLTYLTGGATAVGKVGASGAVRAGARMGFRETADLAIRQGRDDLADKVLRSRTPSALTATEQAELGIKAGVNFGVGRAKLHVPGSDRAVRGLRQRATTPALHRVQSSRAGSWLSDQLDSQKLNQIRREHGPVAARKAGAARRQAATAGRATKNLLQHDLAELHKEFRGVDTAAVTRKMEDPSAHAGPREERAAQALAEWFDRAHAEAERLTGRPIPKLENYLPHQLTAEFRSLLDATGAKPRAHRNATTRAAFEKNRHYRQGVTWFGQELREGTLDEMERIAREALGADYVQVFQSDPWRLALGYARAMERAVAAGQLGNRLEAMGLARYMPGGGGLDADAVARVADARATRAEGRGEDLLARAADTGADADEYADAARGLREAGEVEVDQASRLAVLFGRQADRAGADDAALDARVAELGAAAPQRLRPDVRAAAKTVDTAEKDLARIEQSLRDLGPRPQLRAAGRGGGPAVEAPKAKPPRRPQLAKPRKIEPADPAKVKAANAADERRIEELTAQGRRRVAESERPELYRALDTQDFRGTEADLARVAKAADALAESKPNVAATLREHLEVVAAAASRTERKEAIRDLASDMRAARRTLPARLHTDIKSKRHLPRDIEAQVTKLREGIDARNHSLRANAEAVATEAARVERINANRLAAHAERLERMAVEAEQVAAVAETLPVEARAAWTRQTKRLLAKRETARAQVANAVEDFDHMRAQHRHWTELVEANEARRAELAAVQGQRSARQVQELAYRDEAARLAAEALRTADPNAAEVARLEALAAQASAKAVRDGTKALEALDVGAALRARTDEWQAMLADGFRNHLDASPDRYASPEVAEMAAEFVAWSAPENVPQIIRFVDTVQSRWKAYALFTPAYHVRNFYGGVFQNSLAGVDLASDAKFVRAWAQWRRGGKNPEAISDPQVRAIWREMDEVQAIFGEGRVRDLADVQMGAGRRGVGNRALGAKARPGLDRWDPTSLDFKGLELNTLAAQGVERQLRGSLYLDRRLKGFTPDEALEATYKYHFNYDDLSHVERTYGRRIIPFYTWMRKNLPLQLEHMILAPGKYARFNHLKNNLELGTEEDPFKPEWMDEVMAMRLHPDLPFGGDGDRYLSLDMPFLRLEQTFDANQVVSNMSPFIKTPIEVMANKQFFSQQEIEPSWAERQPVPTAWKPLVPVLEVLGGKMGLPLVTRNDDGQALIGRKDAYKIEQALPLFQRTRRLFPSESHLKQRLDTSWWSIMLGVSSRTLTEDQRRQERERQEAA
jgi:hypothetical protein